MKAKKIIMAIMAVSVILISCTKSGEILQTVVKNPEVALSNLSITDISVTGMDLDLDLAVTNPNAIGITLTSLDYAIGMADKPLASGTTKERVEIVARGVTHAKVPVFFNYSDVGAVYDSFKDQDEVPYQVSGTMKISTPIGDIPIPFKFTGKMPVVRPPSIKDVGLRVDKITLGTAAVTLTLKLFNPNTFKLEVTTADYALNLDGKSFSSGSIPPTTIAPKESGDIYVPVTLSFATVGGWAYSLLTKGSATYDLSYFAYYNILDKPVTHKAEKSGTLQIWK